MTLESRTEWILREDVAYAAELRDLVDRGGLDAADEAEEVPTSNRRTGLRRVPFPPAGGALYVKRFGIEPGSSAWRRLGLWLSGIGRDHALASYRGARLLEDEGVPTCRAVGYASWRAGPLQRAGRVAFEEVPGESLRAFRGRLGTDPGPEERAQFSELVAELARLVRRMHERGLRHGSVEVGNVLVSPRPDADAVPGSPPPRLVLIDTDRVRRARFRIPLLERFLDLRDLCRLDFDAEGRRFVLACYLQRDDPGGWWLILQLWSLVRFRLRKWWRHRHRRIRVRAEPRAPAPGPRDPRPHEAGHHEAGPRESGTGLG